MDARYRGENRRRVELVIRGALLQFMRQDVEQHLGIGIGIDVAQVLPEQLAFELVGIGQIAVVTEHDTERRIDMWAADSPARPRRAGGRITRVRDAACAEKAAHIASAKYVAHHAAALVHMECRTLGGNNAGCVLAAMLQHQQTIIEQLVYLILCYSTKNSAHNGPYS